MFRTYLFKFSVLACISVAPADAGQIRIAAASDLRYAMDEIVQAFRSEFPDEKVDVTYGSSGKFATQIQEGAPFDLYFSADISYPRQLEEKGLAASPVYPYAVGRIVLWSIKRELLLTELIDKSVKRIAIANYRHAPYGQRAKEALESIGIWELIAEKLVMGDNIAQAAQFVETGAADAGIIALSLVMSPALKDKGHWILIDELFHKPLEQGFVITRYAADNELAKTFAEYMSRTETIKILKDYGFTLPDQSRKAGL